MVVDDRSLPRLAARAMLAEVRGLRLIGEAASGKEAVELYPRLKPDIVLLDVQMPDMSGPETAARLLTVDDSVTIVAWSVSDDSDDLVRMMQAGCVGYVLKDVGPQEMGRALLAAVRGEVPIPRHLVREALLRAVAPESVPDESPALSPRETEILRLLGRGHATKQIAAELGISSRSVDTHLRHVYRKLAVRSRGEAVNRGLRLGLLSASDL
jgi:DNA-binding NarL/FixJ family response regulator